MFDDSVNLQTLTIKLKPFTKKVCSVGFWILISDEVNRISLLSVFPHKVLQPLESKGPGQPPTIQEITKKH